MLRGRRSCAISGLPTPSPALQSPLTPLFPLHTRNVPVSPFFPLLTQKQGGGGPETSLFSFSANRAIARSCPLGSSRLRLCALGVLCGESLFNSGDSVPNSQIPAKNIETAYITVPLSIIILNIVGAPTFSFQRPISGSQKWGGKTREHRPFDTQGKQECLRHRKEEPKTQVKNRTWGTQQKDGFLAPAKCTGRKNSASRTPFEMTNRSWGQTGLTGQGLDAAGEGVPCGGVADGITNLLQNNYKGSCPQRDAMNLACGPQVVGRQEEQKNDRR